LSAALLFLIFGHVSLTAFLLITCGGLASAVFFFRDEAKTLNRLTSYFAGKARSDNPAEFFSAEAGTALRAHCDNADINELIWTVSSAEQQALTAYRDLYLERQYRGQILNNLPLPLIIIDEQLKISEFNEQALGLFDHIETGKPVAFVIRNNDLIEKIRAVSQNIQPFSETEFNLEGKGQRLFSVLISAFSVGRHGHTAIIFIDRTLAIQAEKMRSDFVANVSHELRTPLTSVLGFIETLQGPAGDDPATRRKFLAIVSQQSERMVRLVTDQLSLARIEETEHHTPQERCDLVQISERVITLLQKQARENDVSVIFVPPPQPVIINGNADELVQMVQNLAENAIRYGRRGGEVSIKLYERASCPQNGQQPCCAIAVHDDGEGIAPDHIPRLTERFYRIDKDRSRTGGGTGLGLAIVKHIVNHHNGYLDIRSELNKGSVFTVFLPRT